MKKHLLFSLLLATGWMITACGGRKAADSCHVAATVGFPEYTQACLKDDAGKILDTLQLSDGQITFVRTDTANMPYVALISLMNPLDSLDRADMPIVVEGGRVNVEIGEYITTSGTPLNVKLQEFLNDLQTTSDAIRKQEISLDDLKRTYSEFYRQQILSNQNNVVGQFILHHYGFHLNKTDAELVKAQLGN